MLNALKTQSSKLVTESRKRIMLVQHSPFHTGSTVSGHGLARGFLQNGWEVDAVFGYDGEYPHLYERDGCRIHRIKHLVWLRDRGLARFLYRLWQDRPGVHEFVALVRKTRPSVVYINSLVSLAAAIAARKCSIPVIWHIRELFENAGGEMRCPAYLRSTFARSMITRYSQERIAISRVAARNVLGTDNAPNLNIIPNAVEDDFFEASLTRPESRRQFNLPRDCPIIGVPGTLRPVKGHAFFLRAATRLKETHPECRFAITGDGNPRFRQEIEELIARLGLSGHAHLLGQIENMPSFYKACDVICVPSRSESFGRVVIESFACGTPVVASDVGGIPEIVSHEDTGLLVTYDDENQLVFSLSRILDDTGLRDRIARNARKKADREYRADICRRRVIEVVEDVLTDSNKV